MDSARRAAADSPSLDQLARVYAMVDQIQRARRVEHVYEEAVEGLRGILPLDQVALLADSADEGMAVRVSHGLGPATREALAGYAPWPRTRRDPRVIVDASLERKADQPVYAALLEDGVSTAAWVPMFHRGRLTGQFLLGRSDGDFSEAELRLAEAMAGHVAFSIWRTRSAEDQAELLRRFEAERSVLESVVNQMPAGVLLADVPTGRIIMSNPQVTAIWGKSLRHTGQVSDYEMWGGWTAGGQPLDPRAWPLARSVLHGEAIRGEEIEIERANGSRGVIRMSAAPVKDSRGRQLAAVATVFDVTRDREEEHRKAFLEQATEALNASLEIDATLAGLARTVVGPYADWCVLYRVRDGRIQATAAVHHDPGMADRVQPFAGGSCARDGDALLARALRERQPHLVVRPSGDPLAAMTADPGRVDDDAAPACACALILPLVSRDRELGVLAVAREEGRFDDDDLSLMKELARRAAVAMDNALLYERARAADTAKANFLAVMSHEFRTPLSAILGYADILTARVHGEVNEKQANHLERVKASVRHLSHLVDEILSFASMEAGRERVVRSKVELRSLLVDAVGIMEPIAEAAGLTLDVALGDDPVALAADASKVRQVVINLVSNALKYTPQGEVGVTLSREGDRAVIQVTDTGPGIAPEHAERVFEPFWQVDRNDGGHITGTGLGLSVARELARLMGGDLQLDSEVGRGSRFSFSLPLEPGEVAGGSPG